MTRRVSVNTLGGESNAASTEPSISADGRFVAFESRATTLLGYDATGQDAPKMLVNPDGIFDLDDTNFVPDVFVHDLATGRTERASVASDGTQSDLDSYGASISGDGRWVAFVSLARNLVPGDTNKVREVFLHDRQTGKTTRVGLGPTGAQGKKASVQPVMAGDGSTVVFVSDSGNLVPEDRNHEGDIFARRLHPS
jgi:Tol biopolymer transport system component